MMWFLVLLFWNPTTQAYDVADGWYPMPFATETICEMKLDFVSMYLPNYSADIETTVECIESPDMWTAIEQARKNANE